MRMASETTEIIEPVTEIEMISETDIIDDLHSPVSDTEQSIIVNEATRSFTIPTDFNPIIGVVGDCNSEMVSFLVPKFIDSHNIFECSEKKIFWKNKEAFTEGESDAFEVVESDEDHLKIQWLISDKIAANAGEITFALQISDYDEDGTLIYRWKTIDGEGIRIESTQFGESVNETIQKSFVKLVDQTTGEKYKLYVTNGKLLMGKGEG